MTRQTDLAEIVFNDPPPTAGGKVALRAATELYVKHLENLAVKAQELGRDAQASRDQREADALKLELLGDEEHQGRLHLTQIRLMPQHVKPIGKGLEFWLKNLRAAKGTVKALGKTELAEEFEEEAKRVEGTLLPLFQEQQSLPLTTPAAEPPPRPDTAPAKSLKEIADDEAEKAEAEGAEAKDGVMPISRGRRRKRAGT